MKKINIFIIVNLIFAVIFSLLNIYFVSDISCLAFVLSIVYSAILIWFAGFKFLKQKQFEKVFLCRKLFQYESFVFFLAFILRRAGTKGTVYAFDLISVILWLLVFISACVISYWLDFKHFEEISGIKVHIIKNESLTKMLAKGKTRDGSKVTPLAYLKWFLFEILDWADALVQAVFLVLLFQIFFFQFYKIPSESMVPEYMVNDRLAVSKITSGPKFPLSDVGLPNMKDYKRGDIVVFRNPHYTIDRQSEVKSVVSQLIYMLTFTFVNTNLDENGNVKADPLVKRITGIPGEQLMMQDGILYSRTKDNNNFEPVEQDSLWAAYNLNDENPELKKLIQEFPVSNELFHEFENLEKFRTSFDLSDWAELCKSLAQEYSQLTGDKQISVSNDALLNSIDLNFLNLRNIIVERRGGGIDISTNFIQTIHSSEYRTQWFNAFMTDWIDSVALLTKDGYIGGNFYEESCFKLNLMFKYFLGKYFVEVIKNSSLSNPSESWKETPDMIQIYSNLYISYIYMYFYELRNMPVFPTNDSNGNPMYLPDDCYFMMGDNRFNSFDMRHSDEEITEKLSKLDDYSIIFTSHLNPMYVQKKLILGSTGIRIWPFSRPERRIKITK